MTELYACKYKVQIGCDEENKPVMVPVGTVFIIDGIAANSLALKPVTKATSVKHDYPVMVTPELLEFAFTKNDYLVIEVDK